MPFVTARFEFGLPFGITMLGDDASTSYTLQKDEYKVKIYPPTRWDKENEKYCWNSDSNRPIGGFNNQPFWLADHILIDVGLEVNSYALTQEDADGFRDIANEFLLKILRTCRWRTRQGNIDINQLPGSYSVHYYDDKGNIMRNGVANIAGVMVVHATIGLPHLDKDTWGTICEDIVKRSEPELWEELLIDARDVFLKHPRRAIIDAGSACEVFIEAFCNKLADSLSVDKEVYNQLAPRNRTFPEYFHIVMRYLVRRSLKDEQPDVYKEIDGLYRAMNSVRHEGLCQYKTERGKIVYVGTQETGRMINAAESAIKWASSLST